MISAFAFWAVGLALWPLLLWQGLRARRDTPKLPEAPGCRQSRGWPAGSARALLCIGDSPFAGVGVRRYADSIPACLAAALSSAADGSPLAWRTLAASGARFADLVPSLPLTPIPTRVVVCIGVNDVTGLTSVRSWTRRLRQLIERIDGRAQVVMLGVPPMQAFPALPWPLNHWLGWRAAMLNAASRRLLQPMASAQFLAVPPITESKLLASDGFHPSADGARQWSEQIAQALHAADCTA